MAQNDHDKEEAMTQVHVSDEMIVPDQKAAPIQEPTTEMEMSVSPTDGGLYDSEAGLSAHHFGN